MKRQRPVSRKFRPVLDRLRIATKKVLEDWDCVKEEVNAGGFVLINHQLLEDLDKAFEKVEAVVNPFNPDEYRGDDGIRKPEAA